MNGHLNVNSLYFFFYDLTKISTTKKDIGRSNKQIKVNLNMYL